MTHNMIGLLQPNGEVEEYANTNGGGGGSSKPVKVSYDTSPATKAHAVDSFIYYNDSVYKVTSAISIGDTLTVGTNISTDIGLEADTEICIDGLPNSSSNDKNFIGTRAQWEALTTVQQNAYDTVDITDDEEKSYTINYVDYSISGEHAFDGSGYARAQDGVTLTSKDTVLAATIIYVTSSADVIVIQGFGKNSNTNGLYFVLRSKPNGYFNDITVRFVYKREV